MRRARQFVGIGISPAFVHVTQNIQDLWWFDRFDFWWLGIVKEAR